MIYLYFRGAVYYPEGGTDDLARVFQADDDAAAIAYVRQHETPLNDYEWDDLVAVSEHGARSRISGSRGCVKASREVPADEAVGTWVVDTKPEPEKGAGWSFSDKDAAMNFAHSDYRLCGKRIYVWRVEGNAYTRVWSGAR